MEAYSLSPRELSNVLGVSESSVKRWVDAGKIPVSRTAGGHRRIMLPDALRFVRRQGMRLVRPELLGLEDVAAMALSDAEPLSGGALADAIEADEAQRVRGLVLQAYLSGMEPEAIFDGPVAGAMERFGTLHESDRMGISHEHRFTQICLQALSQLRMVQPTPDPDAPLALGGAPEHDPYQLPSLMASIVFSEAGYREINLGPNLPATSLVLAAERFGADVVWISATSPLDDTAFLEVRDAALALQEKGHEVMVGGREAIERAADWPSSLKPLRRMQDLAAAIRARGA